MRGPKISLLGQTKIHKVAQPFKRKPSELPTVPADISTFNPVISFNCKGALLIFH